MQKKNRLAAGASAALVTAGLLGAGITAAGPADAARTPAITVADRTLHVGQLVKFQASGLNPAAGYYVMLCQNQPDFFPVCARPGEIRNSFVHLSNRDTQAVAIAKNGTASGTLRIALHDTSLFGPIPNDTRVNCAAFGGCSVAIVEDHQSSRSLGGMAPQRLAATPVRVR
ncbi:hypothetical protein [Gordonia sp. VNK21]|uniref:hypothetical protein n=1 Tax=Gordonia sp. VNK21 TaxID=3382483 RepID=UPI0038D4E313